MVIKETTVACGYKKFQLVGNCALWIKRFSFETGGFFFAIAVVTVLTNCETNNHHLPKMSQLFVTAVVANKKKPLSIVALCIHYFKHFCEAMHKLMQLFHFCCVLGWVLLSINRVSILANLC